MFSDDRKLKLSMVEEHYYSTTPGASSEQLPFTAGSQAARLLSRQRHTVLISCRFSTARKMYYVHWLSRMSKGTSMVTTSEWVLLRSNLWAQTKGVQHQHSTIWRTGSSSIAPVPEAVVSCGVRSSQKQHRRLYHSESQFVRTIACVVTSPVSSAVRKSKRKWYSKDQGAASLAKTLYIEQKTLHSSMSAIDNPRYLYSPSICHLEDLSDSSCGSSQHRLGLRPRPPPGHRWSSS